MKIKSIKAIEILDSRSTPTLQTTVILEDGSIGSAAVPSGASTGKYEAVELRDGDSKRFNGLGVINAINNVNTIINNTICGMDAEGQENIDNKMIEIDSTDNKAKLGANAILSVSLAVARAQAISEKIPLYQYLTKFNPDFNGTYLMPIPQMNIMNGGKHANWATDIQEYMILPINFKTVKDSIRAGSEIYFNLKKLLKSKNYNTNVGDEGGFAPSVISNEEPFQLISTAITTAGYQLGKDIFLGIDAAASEIFNNNKYHLNKEKKDLTSVELMNWLLDLKTRYPIISMEDIFDQDDWEGFKMTTDKVKNSTQIVGDDLYVTNIKRLQMGVENKSTNSILIKLNQIGTLTETIKAILLARKNSMTAIVSHRSGETEDTFIADFVVAMGTGQIKTGAPARSERCAKYNRLIQIENELGEKAQFAKFPFKIP